MADLPIPFSAPMVQALLREIENPGTGKTQTRRALNPQPRIKPELCDYGRGRPYWAVFDGDEEAHKVPVRYGVGDRLYVREHWRSEAISDQYPPRDLMAGQVGLHFEADGEAPDWAGRHRQGMHMPRWASRITLLVTEVRVERLQDCSETDAIAEGVIWQDPTDEDRAWARDYAEENGGDPSIQGVWIAPGTRQGWGMTQEDRDRPQWGPTAAFAYRCLWDSINGTGAWDSNPWVAAYTFRPILGNIDSIPA